jgi:hypothetical protein
MEVSGQLHVLAALPPGKDPLYQMDRSLDEPQGSSGRGGKEENSCPCRESNPGRPARNLVTVLSYPGSYATMVQLMNS